VTSESRDATDMRFIRATRIAASPEAVFRFHEDPDALERLTPPWEPMRVVETAHSLLPGSRVVLRGRILGVPVTWVAVHTHYEPPLLFADRLESGPFASWQHRHLMLPHPDGGTVLRDEIDYELPFGRPGRWLGGWFVRRRLEKLFAYRHQVTRDALEQGTPHVDRRAV
jgi:ligand-binding SRPBCC domain-containing protein